MPMVSRAALAVLLLAPVGCEKDTATNNPDGSKGEARESDAPEDLFPDDEPVEDEEQPY